MRPVRIGMIALIILMAFGLSAAEIYKWVDENGVTHYSDSPTTQQEPDDAELQETVPAAESKPAAGPEITTLTPQQNERNELMESISKLLGESEPVAEKKGASVELYVTDSCPWCKKAEQFFDREGVDYVRYNVQRDPKAASRLRSLTNYKGVPFAVVNGHKIKGYSAAAYRQALNSR